MSKKYSSGIDSKDTYKIILENLPSIIFTKNSDLILTYINSQGEKLLGKKVQEIIGKNDYDFFSVEQAKKLREKDKEVLRSNKAVSSYEEIQVEGRKLTLKNQKIPLVDENGNKFILVISQDITEFKQKECELNALGTKSGYKSPSVVNF